MKTAHKGGNGAYVRSTSDPLYVVTTAHEEMGVCEPFLVNYHGRSGAASVDAPAPTLTTSDRLGLVEPVALDIRLPMLQPHELAAAMSFPKDYRFAGTRSDVSARSETRPRAGPPRRCAERRSRTQSRDPRRAPLPRLGAVAPDPA